MKIPDNGDMIALEGASKSFAGRNALQDVTLRIDSGETVALLGPNGAGKTTLIRIMLGLLKPDSGTVSLCGRQPSCDGTALRTQVGCVLDAPGHYPEMSVWENLNYYANIYGRAHWQSRAEQLLDEFHLGARKHDMAGSLSRGLQQMLALCRALLADPRLLILDEPSTGLDPKAQLEVRRILRKLREQRRSVIFSTHNLEEAEDTASRVVLMNRGRIVLDKTAEQLQESRELHVECLEFECTEVRDVAVAAACVHGVLAVPVERTFCEVLPSLGDAVSRWIVELAERGIEVKRAGRRSASLRSLYCMLIDRE